MGRGWNWEMVRVERALGQWIMVPITEVGWWILGTGTRGMSGVMGSCGRLSSDEVGNRDFSAGVLDMIF